MILPYKGTKRRGIIGMALRRFYNGLIRRNGSGG